MSESKIELFEQLVDVYKAFREIYYSYPHYLVGDLEDYVMAIFNNFELLLASILFELYMVDNVVAFKKGDG